MALIEITLRPTSPWRAGHRTGDRERVDAVYHSDALYSAVTHAMASLGWVEEWLDATARREHGSLVRFSSLFPKVAAADGGVRLIPPPRTTWPPATPGRLYAKGARLVPLEVAIHGLKDESKWTVDGATECLLPAGVAAPFSVAMRSGAAVDRLTGNTEPHRTACLEFAPGAAWWGLIELIPAETYAEAGTDWEARVKSALRLLADSGFGGERSLGWGRAAEPEFSDASELFPASTSSAWWLLSLYSPHGDDGVDWSQGNYSAIARGGWTDSRAGATRKKHVRMIEEGSVLAAAALRGRAVDVAPEGFPHPAYRSGFALAVPLASRLPQEVEG